ncbi:hypothetical protein AB205_0002580 [Aquarana catesbeiana]|uniref:RRM domain-containing protein n=1 Tax=Aquarana catesbeiana TaxID=8400 RepID=A0A2G9S917_AQUCT|nr:hypothetical protein AB205_0002580 [Aquarana catesbeiana]
MHLSQFKYKKMFILMYALLIDLLYFSTGYGFVDFDSPGAAQKAVSALKSSGVQAQMAKQQEQDPTNLYISNLPVSMDEQELESLLKPFGQVISTRILRDASGTSRGVGFARMESTEKCEAVISHFNGKYMKTPPGVPAPQEPLLCKFADGGQKKRQTQGKYIQNGRGWPREGETGGMTLTYDPTTALQNGFYTTPYSIAPNRVIAQAALSPYLPSPVSSYQVHNPSWMHHQSYLMQPAGTVLTPTMDHAISIQPASMMGPLTQQLGHLSMGSTGAMTSWLKLTKWSQVYASCSRYAGGLHPPVLVRAFYCLPRGEQRAASTSGTHHRPRRLFVPVKESVEYFFLFLFKCVPYKEIAVPGHKPAERETAGNVETEIRGSCESKSRCSIFVYKWSPRWRKTEIFEVERYLPTQNLGAGRRFIAEETYYISSEI